MKRIASLILALVMLLTVIPVTAQAAEMDWEDPILDYGTLFGVEEMDGVELMASGTEQTFEMADIPKGGSYQPLSASQEMIDIIKDFEGFRSQAYWDNSQWTVGYGTRCPDDMLEEYDADTGRDITEAGLKRCSRKCSGILKAKSIITSTNILCP